MDQESPLPSHIRQLPVIAETHSGDSMSTGTKQDSAATPNPASVVADEDPDLLEVFCSPVTLEQFVYDEEKEASKEGKEGTVKKYFGFSAPLLVFLLVCVVFLVLCREYLSSFLDWLQKLPAAESILIFNLMFTIVSFPMTFGYLILNLAAGYLYGFVWGQLVVTISVAMGTSIAFLVCRHFCRGLVHQWMDMRSVQAIIRVVEGPKGFKVIALTRLTPLPFGLQNAMFALTDISYSSFITASVLGLVPTQVLNTYMGSTLRNMHEVLADRADGYMILISQVVIGIALMVYVVRRARRELAALTSEQDIEKG